MSVEAEAMLLETTDGLVLSGEALLRRSPWAAAVMCHPHPLYGGDMHNTVVEAV